MGECDSVCTSVSEQGVMVCGTDHSPKTSFIVPVFLLLTALPLVLYHCLQPFSSSLWTSRATCSSRAGSQPCVIAVLSAFGSRAQPEAEHVNPMLPIRRQSADCISRWCVLLVGRQEWRVLQPQVSSGVIVLL